MTLMYSYSIYQAWCQGKSKHDIEHRSHEFVEVCARIFCYSEDETVNMLKRQPWFKYPGKAE